MKRLHYISGLIITLFIGLHLFNHLFSVFGAESHIELMDKLRVVYRNPIVETLLLTTVFFQIISGVKLFLTKRKLASSFYEKLQIWTGLYLAFFFLIHIGAVFTGRYILDLDTNFYFGAAGINTFPLNLFFIPYYGLAILSFFGHISAIHVKKMKKEFLGLAIKQQAGLIMAIGFLVMIATLYGLTGGFAGIEIPEEYDILLLGY